MLEEGLEVVAFVEALVLELLHVRFEDLLHAFVVLEPWLSMSCLVCHTFHYFTVTAYSYMSSELNNLSS